MKYLLAALLLTVCAYAYSSATSFTPPKGGRVLSRAEAEQYIKAASTLSRYKLPWIDRPTVVIVPPSWFNEKLCGRPCSVIGVVLWAEPNTIYIRGGLSHSDTQATIVHEAVHWLQIHSGWTGDHHDCSNVAAHEAEAYSVGYLYEVLTQGEGKDGFWTPDLSCGPDNGNH